MKKWLGVHLSMVFLIVILFSVSSGAGELPSYHKYQGPLKPGMEITKENFDRYLPELQKLLPPAKLQWYEIGLKKGVVTIPIAENVQYPLSRGQREATGKYGGTARVNADNQLVGWVAGVPFPKPKNALEIVWNGCPTISRGGNIDDTLLPAYFYLFQETKYEKHFQWEERNRRYRGRTDIPPLGDMPDFTEGNIIQKESFVIVDPHEVKGFIQLRIRYWDIDKPDDCYGYIPAIRRVRRLTGNDLTDPLLGSDCISDDFEAWRQKMNSKMEFRALECRDFLVPRVYIGANNKPPYHYQKHGPFFQVTCCIKDMFLSLNSLLKN